MSSAELYGKAPISVATRLNEGRTYPSIVELDSRLFYLTGQDDEG